jgi:hypothetical protein
MKTQLRDRSAAFTPLQLANNGSRGEEAAVTLNTDVEAG